jgi:hypothetical protein
VKKPDLNSSSGAILAGAAGVGVVGGVASLAYMEQ